MHKACCSRQGYRLYQIHRLRHAHNKKRDFSQLSQNMCWQITLLNLELDVCYQVPHCSLLSWLALAVPRYLADSSSSEALLGTAFANRPSTSSSVLLPLVCVGAAFESAGDRRARVPPPDAEVACVRMSLYTG